MKKAHDLYKTVVEMEAIGVTGALQTHGHRCNQMRSDMFAKGISSCQVITNSEFPHMFTGYEQHIGEYTYDSTRRENPVKIIDVVCKYNINLGMGAIGDNPVKTVIYRDLETNEIGYFDIRKYTRLSEGYGYENVLSPFNLTKGTILRPEQVLSQSPSFKDGLYCNGVNANVAYMTTPNTTEDAIPIRRGFAEKLSPMAMEKVVINFDLRKFPLNLNGDKNEYKIIPDIGEKVSDSGIIAAFRRTTDCSSISDLTQDSLSTVEFIYDDPVYTLSGGTVLDVDVYINKIHKSTPFPANVYDQLYKYSKASYPYYKRIYEVYQENPELVPTGKFSTLVSTAIGRLLVAGDTIRDFKRNSNKLVDKHHEFNIIAEILVAKNVEVNKGYKLTDAYGTKGVIGEIKDDEYFPVNEFGIKADILIDPVSMSKRTSVGQSRIQYLNWAAKWVAMNLYKLPDTDARMTQIVDFVRCLNPTQADILLKSYKHIRDREAFVEFCMNDTIYLHHAPTSNLDDDDTILEVTEKFNVPLSKVTWMEKDRAGNKKKIVSEVPVCIGSKYIYLLHKYPKPLAPGFGYIDKLHLPRAGKNKRVAPIGSTPCKFGEAEHRMFIIAGAGDVITRMKCLYGNSTKGPEAVITSLLKSKHPSRLKRVDISTEELRDRESPIHSSNNMLRTIGVELQDVLIDEDVAEKRFKVLEELILK